MKVPYPASGTIIPVEIKENLNGLLGKRALGQ